MRNPSKSAPLEHNASTYTNHGCRCLVCREANSSAVANWRARRATERVLIDGRLTAPVPPDMHGKASTYRNHACRCVPCKNANTANQRDKRAAPVPA